ncbi:zinc finger protein 76-like [Bradysia coprophila]|uniref:zinc finger protein 76-like n=1 Tax=Bradysia coprophila TaxID=38358 RepID=UPI00187D8E39|nr:zinc finger protein 76-like [Bradysia coprophila]XP_037041447.1 zinc finger protein 76-like [Bradysia coprophila]
MAKRIAENPAEIYECEHCDKSFTCRKSFSRHMKEVTTDSRIICIVPRCDSTFSRTDSYRYHLTHTHRKDFAFSNEVWKSSTKKILSLMEEQIEANDSGKKDDDTPQRLTKKRKVEVPIAKDNIQDIAESHAPFTASSTNSDAKRLKEIVSVKKFHIPPFETKGDSVRKGELRDYFVGMAQMFCNANETVKVIRKELAIEMETITVSATATAEMVSETLPSTPPCPAVSIQDYHDDDDNVYLPSSPRSLAVSRGDYDDDESIDDPGAPMISNHQPGAKMIS